MPAVCHLCILCTVSKWHIYKLVPNHH